MTLHGLSKCVVGGNIDRDGGRVGQFTAKSFGSSESPTCDGELVVESSNVFGEGRGDETGTEEKNLLLAGLGCL